MSPLILVRYHEAARATADVPKHPTQPKLFKRSDGPLKTPCLKSWTRVGSSLCIGRFAVVNPPFIFDQFRDPCAEISCIYTTSTIWLRERAGRSAEPEVIEALLIRNPYHAEKHEKEERERCRLLCNGFLSSFHLRDHLCSDACPNRKRS